MHWDNASNGKAKEIHLVPLLGKQGLSWQYRLHLGGLITPAFNRYFKRAASFEWNPEQRKNLFLNLYCILLNWSLVCLEFVSYPRIILHFWFFVSTHPPPSTGVPCMCHNTCFIVEASFSWLKQKQKYSVSKSTLTFDTRRMGEGVICKTDVSAPRKLAYGVSYDSMACYIPMYLSMALPCLCSLWWSILQCLRLIVYYLCMKFLIKAQGKSLSGSSELLACSLGP